MFRVGVVRRQCTRNASNNKKKDPKSLVGTSFKWWGEGRGLGVGILYIYVLDYRHVFANLKHC